MIEVDGIRRALEEPITEAGDYISDEWYRMIDLTTSPYLSIRDQVRLESSIRRLNRNLGTTAVILDVHAEGALTPVYDDVADQVNTILAGNEIISVQKIAENLGRLPAYSGCFHWAD